MINLIETIRLKIQKELKPKEFEIIDNTDLHKNHKSFDINKLHLKFIIRSEELRAMERKEAHKRIFSILKDEIKNKIHALEIQIK